MNVSLIICTFQRPHSLLKLLTSVRGQTIYPEEILIIDGSLDKQTEEILKKNRFQNLQYYRVEDKNRGLTRQRNFGISKVGEKMEIICFLDDDTILSSNYFEELLETYKLFPYTAGVGGYIINETEWQKVPFNYSPSPNEFVYDNWVRKEGSRFSLRRKLHLEPDQEPGYMPDFSHGYSTGFLPPSGEIYQVEFFMGYSMSFRADVFKTINFSLFFQGYGLYEDMDFCLRASQLGNLYVNTAASLAHYHDMSGRPNQYEYGKMVVQNGWYVWRVKYPLPSLKAKLKWHATSFLLTLIRLSNTITSKKKKEAFTESMGRIVGWWELMLMSDPRARKKDRD